MKEYVSPIPRNAKRTNRILQYRGFDFVARQGTEGRAGTNTDRMFMTNPEAWPEASRRTMFITVTNPEEKAREP